MANKDQKKDKKADKKKPQEDKPKKKGPTYQTKGANVS